MCHDVQCHVLCRRSFREFAFDVDSHGLWLCLENALRCQHLCDFACAYSHGDGSHCTMGAGVRVSAHDGHAWQGQGFLGTHDVDDAVVLGAHSEMRDAKLLAVVGKCLHLPATNWVVDAFLLVAGSVVVGHGIDVVGTEYSDMFVPQSVECLRACYFVRIEPIYVQLCGTVFHVLHYVAVPYLVEESVHDVECDNVSYWLLGIGLLLTHGGYK